MIDSQNHIRLYRPLIEREVRISRNLLKVNNLYRISTYKDVDGNSKRYSGSEGNLFFVTGIYERKLYGLKVSLIKPQFFFEWFNELVESKSPILESNKMISLNELAPSSDIRGTNTYNNLIKNNPKLEKPQIPYRVYKLDGIKYISEVFIKKSTLEMYYG